MKDINKYLEEIQLVANLWIIDRSGSISLEASLMAEDHLKLYFSSGFKMINI